MVDERTFIKQVEAAGPRQFADLVKNAGPDEERALRVHLGDEGFERAHQLALEQQLVRGDAAPEGRVVVLHGIMGSELGDPMGPIWMNPFRLVAGEFISLALDPDGNSVQQVSATGMLKLVYGLLELRLLQKWDARSFCYDWRLNIATLADRLDQQIGEWFSDSGPVHMVAHSMGGLVARAMIARHPERWAKMAGRLVMLGTPNHGSFAIPRLFTGQDPTLKMLADADLAHSQKELLDTIKTFTGAWQMLPSRLAMTEAARFYNQETWGSLQPDARVLQEAQTLHEAIRGVIDKDRMVYVAGYNRRTAAGLSGGALNNEGGYTYTMRGDGTVSHSLGLLEGVPAFYVDEEHSRLPLNIKVLRAIDDLLTKGAAEESLLCQGLADTVANEVRGDADTSHAALEMTARAQLRTNRAAIPINDAELSHLVTPEERAMRELLFRNFLSTDAVPIAETPAAEAGAVVRCESAAVPPAAAETAKSIAADATSPVAPATPGVATPDIRVRVVVGSIADVPPPLGTLPVDAIAVGHYQGVRPQFAEAALDHAISEPLLSAMGGAVEPLLGQFTDRGLIRAELGQPFFFDDPRQPGRLIAIAGMGQPGRFGAPELTVLARELCWALERFGKRHLASVLIGAGTNNLDVRDAVHAWMRGIQRNLPGTGDRLHRVEALSFVEFKEERAKAIRGALRTEKDRMEKEGFVIELVDFPDEPAPGPQVRRADDIATQLTIGLVNNVFRFGAITRDAAVPERDVAVDPALVWEINDRLAAERDPRRQAQRGDFLLRLMFPRDLQPHLTGGAPIVLLCDNTVARIHWEVMAQPLDTDSLKTPEDGNYLGLCRGVTRQLLTVFAPLPEPPPPRKRELRILLLADTAADAPLPGARAEALDLLKLFERYNRTAGPDGNRITVVPLIGPNQANRPDILELLMRHPPFDMLHFAGHCKYDKDNPERSGWIFNGGQRLTANELSRVDRVPPFVFSNACESGITPSRSEMRSPELAPTFAEAFFARGVSNFVCTAWPVDDQASRTFAKRLYTGLLGIGQDPEAMHVAMRQARLAIQDGGTLIWGAYQHYGNPYFRAFRAEKKEEP
jgi:pimeloyl-ACP methyl ester carboxylesterase